VSYSVDEEGSDGGCAKDRGERLSSIGIRTMRRVRAKSRNIGLRLEVPNSRESRRVSTSMASIGVSRRDVQSACGAVRAASTSAISEGLRVFAGAIEVV
jgi:hypothetical protein